jgi:signal transduction histidine kinase/DNA-binding response OmpR family regulator/ligand-binding sensor domain-containing protein
MVNICRPLKLLQTFRITKVAWLIIFSTASTYTLTSQVPFSPKTAEPITESWRWRSMDMIAAKGVRCMLDDAKGNMWFGVDKGIVRYDGYEMTVYDQQDYLKFPVGTLYQTDDGKLYAGSESGLLIFDNDKWEKLFPATDSIHVSITCMEQTPDGGLLAGVQDGFLLLNDNKITVFSAYSRIDHFHQLHPDINFIVLPDEIMFQRNFGRVDAIHTVNNNHIWMFVSRNNDGKLLKFNITDTINGVLQKFSVTTELGGIPLSNRNQIIETSDGEIWIINGFYKSGIIRQRSHKWELLKLSDLFGGDELHTSIMEVTDGSIWIGGLGKLFVLKNQKWDVYAAPAPPIPSSRIILHEATDGQIWIAGIQGDVFRLSYNNDRWTKYVGLNFQCVDEEHTEWFISVEGQVVFNKKGGWFTYDVRHGLIDTPVKLVATKSNRIWVAGSHHGVAATAYLENNHWHKQSHPRLSWGIDPRSVFEDVTGSLWFGASVDRQDALGQVSGVLQLLNPYDTEFIWKHHTQQDGINQHNVYGIGQSPDGSMWLGGTNLLTYQGNRWRTLPGKEFFNEFVDIVYSRENLWVGSRYYGLFRFDGNEWTRYTTIDGLPSNTIISVFEENAQSVWVVTDKDIARYDGSRWHSEIFSSELRIPREGGEILADQDGTVWINKALREWKRRAFPFSITPDEAFDEYWTLRYRPDTMPPKSTIDLFTEHVDQSGNTLIRWSGRDFWEEAPSGSLSYSYRINSGEWSNFSAETSVVLTNLKDGRYTFEVRARDLDFNVETTPSVISFVVKPPIWKQGWFIILVTSFLLIIGFYEYRLIKRNRSLSKLNVSLQDANETLEARQEKIERQKEMILQQKEELEKKTFILEEKNTEISSQRDQLSEMVDKVEELSRVKTRFFTNISHEFRTPLTLILGSIEQLLNAPSNDKSKLNRAYQIIHRNSRRILRLINQILEIRKIETDSLTLQTRPGDFLSFIAGIMQLFQDLANSQSMTLTLHTSYKHIPILFDHDKIEKVFFNLLSNAFKSTMPGGRIEVYIRKKHTHGLDQFSYSDKNVSRKNSSNDKEMLEVVVKDTGQGIPEQYLDKIFERFYQVDESYYHKKYDSSGIGLSYVKDLVAIHNGSIKVESISGEGTSFIVEIPWVNTTADDLSSTDKSLQDQTVPISDDIKLEIENMGKAIQQSRIHEETISSSGTADHEKLLLLLVEDEHELRKFIKEILDPDFNVIEAIHGAQGYELALSLLPDLIITDLMMPVMGGNELCYNLKNNLATNHIPVIMLTAQVAPEKKLEGYQTGADAYIEKPFNTEFLKIRLNNLLQAQQKTREKIMRDLLTQPSEILIHSEDDKVLRKMQEVLEENISNSDFDVESLCQQFYLSRSHFSRKIKQMTGLTPKEIIDSFRLKRAGQLLQQQKLSISEVAYMVGFEHPNSFTRAFRKFYNMTPSEFATQN